MNSSIILLRRACDRRSRQQIFEFADTSPIVRARAAREKDLSQANRLLETLGNEYHTSLDEDIESTYVVVNEREEVHGVISIGRGALGITILAMAVDERVRGTPVWSMLFNTALGHASLKNEKYLYWVPNDADNDTTLMRASRIIGAEIDGPYARLDVPAFLISDFYNTHIGRYS